MIRQILPAIALLLYSVGCQSTPLERAYIANLTFTTAVTTANQLHADGKISDGAYAGVTEAANLASPVLDELNSVATNYAAAQARGANAAELAGIRFSGETVWAKLEPKLLALAAKLLAVQSPATQPADTSIGSIVAPRNATAAYRRVA